jgi:hypothetical protein
VPTSPSGDSRANLDLRSVGGRPNGFESRLGLEARNVCVAWNSPKNAVLKQPDFRMGLGPLGSSKFLSGNRHRLSRVRSRVPVRRHDFRKSSGDPVSTQTAGPCAQGDPSGTRRFSGLRYPTASRCFTHRRTPPGVRNSGLSRTPRLRSSPPASASREQSSLVELRDSLFRTRSFATGSHAPPGT